MIYSANITTLKDTAVTALKRTNINVTKGLVYKVEFHFPSGSAGLMGVAVFDGLYQVWPSSVGEYFIGERQMISFDDMYLKESAPFSFQCYTYNTDDTHAHSVYVRIGLVSKDVFLARFMPTMGADYLNALLKKMEAEKEAQVLVQREMMPITPGEWLGKYVQPVPGVREEPIPKVPDLKEEIVEPEKEPEVVPIVKVPEFIPKYKPT